MIKKIIPGITASILFDPETRLVVKEYDVKTTLVTFENGVTEYKQNLYAVAEKDKPLVRGSFIAIEGNDGSGKDTLLSSLKELSQNDSRMCFVSEPTYDGLGGYIRSMQHKASATVNKDVYDDIFSLLITANRTEEYYREGGVLDKLLSGINVITSRCFLSTLAYHNGNFIDKSCISKINGYILTPDVILFLSVPPEVSLERLNKRRLLDYNENETTIREVYENYGRAKIISEENHGVNVIEIDATKGVDEVFSSAIEKLFFKEIKDFAYRRLGYSDEWLEEKINTCSNLNSDYLNLWTREGIKNG